MLRIHQSSATRLLGRAQFNSSRKYRFVSYRHEHSYTSALNKDFGQQLASTWPARGIGVSDEADFPIMIMAQRLPE
jgi:hypothetical protein